MLLKAVVGNSKKSLSAIIETTRWRPSTVLHELERNWITSVPAYNDNDWQDTQLLPYQMMVFDPGSVTFEVPAGAFCALDVGSQGSVYLNAVWPPQRSEIERLPRKDLIKLLPKPKTGEAVSEVEIVPRSLPKAITCTLHFLVKDTRISLLRGGQTVNVFRAGVFAPTPDVEIKTSNTRLMPYDVISFGGPFALIGETGTTTFLGMVQRSRAN